jgi:hypothetical protein
MGGRGFGARVSSEPLPMPFILSRQEPIVLAHR